ncbi:MAG: Twin-arginine translocation pathway signal [Tardiphaga sp.]|nr:Twin-arginine translocation pathway signal [Tardiphaga sp.]MDB5626944.1 Twin-arginine translocation pathway signal [Tardiphaga sp.]MDB5628767.1 Twin-arginine translocation pathway signal [Tardiphaga sp.]
MSASTTGFGRPSRRSLLIGGVAALGALPLISRNAKAAEWPTRPVKFVVPFSAGGTTDILARLVAQKLSEEYGQQFIVENKTGAGGNIAADSVAKGQADGYTFLVGTPGTHSINKFVFKTMNYDQLNDIAPVIVIAKVPNLCSVTNSLEAKSVAELIALAKAKPNDLLYGTPGIGSTAHLSTELFKSMAGIQMTHVPYKGSAPALTDLIAGRVHVMIDNLPAAQPFAEANSIRPLAVSTAARWPLLDVPTIGDTVAGYDAASWFTVAAPAKTPHDIIVKLNASIDKFLKTEDGIARLRKLGAEPVGGTPEQMQAFVISEMEKWGKVAQFAGLKPE